MHKTLHIQDKNLESKSWDWDRIREIVTSLILKTV